MVENKVSIIVPVYNVEKYIEKCVYSILAQDYNNIEIILVDDGSPDNSGALIDELKAVDSRIVVIHQKNRGVSAARNAGLAVASGMYVTFIDGDDWVDSEYVSHFVQLLEKSECDIAMNKYNYTEKEDLSSEKFYIVDAEKAIEWIYMGTIFVAVWNKIYKKSLLDENHISFNDEIWYGEGMLFNIECLQCTDKVAMTERAVYHQTFNTESAMRKFNLKSNFCGIKSLELQKKLWKKCNVDIENAWQFHRYCFNRSIIDGLVRSNMVADNKKVYATCVSDIRKNIMLPLKMEKSFKKKIAWCCYFISPYLMAIRSKVKYKKMAQSACGYKKSRNS